LISIFNSKIIDFGVDLGFKDHHYPLEGSASCSIHNEIKLIGINLFQEFLATTTAKTISTMR